MRSKNKSKGIADPFLIPVTFVVQISKDNPTNRALVRRKALKLLRSRAARDLNLMIDTRLGRGGIHLDQPFQQIKPRKGR